MRVIQSNLNLQIQTQFFFQTGGRAPAAPVPIPPLKTRRAAPSLLYQNLTSYPSDRRCHIFALHIEHIILDEADDWILIQSNIDQAQIKLTVISKDLITI